MTRFWGVLFGINFAMGVTTGITMEFQFGTNWAYYSHYVGDIFGAPLAIEGLMAFFLESTFVGLSFSAGIGWGSPASGRDVSRRAGVQSVGIVDPDRQRLDAEPGRRRVQRRYDADGAGQLRRSSVQPRRRRQVRAYRGGGLRGGVDVRARSSSYYLLRLRDPSFAVRSFAVAAGFGLASALSVIVLGDESGYTTGEVQKVKLAAIEAEWETAKAAAHVHGVRVSRQAKETDALRASRSPALDAGPDRDALGRHSRWRASRSLRKEAHEVTHPKRHAGLRGAAALKARRSARPTPEASSTA